MTGVRNQFALPSWVVNEISKELSSVTVWTQSAPPNPAGKVYSGLLFLWPHDKLEKFFVFFFILLFLCLTDVFVPELRRRRMTKAAGRSLT